MGRIDDALTARIASEKRRLLVGGMLQEVEWLRHTGDKDERGRQAVSTTMLDALIEQRPALDRSAIDTDRADDTVLIILEPVAILTSHLFRWGFRLTSTRSKRLMGSFRTKNRERDTLAKLS